MNDIELLNLGVKSPCPKCNLGKGLREIDVFELALTGWDNYNFLHCDTCGAIFVGHGDKYTYMKYQIPSSGT